ncbi:NACHT domain-containing protein [Myroides odoratus]|uniref:NACHT domain-containing protein n=1 Tax=Myroides odoratus TaxID=256 RepID=UPI000765B3E0|nr:NACHT domain-containing protein [Myroides odoratus]
MNLETINTISSIAAPFSTIIIDTFLKPKIEDFKKKYDKKSKIIDHFFDNTFKDYLNDCYDKYSTLNTVAFKRNKILLKNVYIPLTIKSYDNSKRFRLDEITDEIFISNKILITDSAGMGKSTISKKLVLSIIENNYGIPILIELRRLNKNKDIVQEIIEQLAPINEEVDKQLVLDLIKRGDFIFFLDGYDEILLSEKQHVTNEIQNFIEKSNRNKFVLTSRPEEAISSFGNFDKFSIVSLDQDEAFELIRKYGNNNDVAELLITKISEPEIFENIQEYLNSPLLVSLLYAAFEYKQKVPFEKHNFYRQVFDSLYESHDLSKGDSFEREKHTKLTLDEFHKVLRVLAFNCLKKDNKIEFNKDEFIKIIEATKDKCPDFNFSVSDLMKDLVVTVPIFSQDGLYYRWSHKSLQEYFAAQFVYCDAKENQKILLEHIAFHDNNSTFYNVLDLYSSIDSEFFNNTVVYKLLKDYFQFLNNSFLNIPDNEDRLFRIQIMFTHYIYLIRHKFGERESGTILFKIIKKYNPKHISMSIGLNVGLEKNLSYIKIPEITNKYFVLLKLLYSKKYDFVEIKDYGISKLKRESVEIKIDLKDDIIYPLNKRKNSTFNNSINFEKVNTLIKMFLCRKNENVLIINKEKATDFIQKIETFNKNKKRNNLLDF